MAAQAGTDHSYRAIHPARARRRVEAVADIDLGDCQQVDAVLAPAQHEFGPVPGWRNVAPVADADDSFVNERELAPAYEERQRPVFAPQGHIALANVDGILERPVIAAARETLHVRVLSFDEDAHLARRPHRRVKPQASGRERVLFQGVIPAAIARLGTRPQFGPEFVTGRLLGDAVLTKRRNRSEARHGGEEQPAHCAPERRMHPCSHLGQFLRSSTRHRR